MIKIITARSNATGDLLVGHMEYSKEFGENIFYELDGDAYFEHEITITNEDYDSRFPTTE